MTTTDDQQDIPIDISTTNCQNDASYTIDSTKKISTTKDKTNNNKNTTLTEQLLITISILIIFVLIGIPIKIDYYEQFNSDLFKDKLIFAIGQGLAMLVIPLSVHSNHRMLFVSCLFCTIIMIISNMYDITNTISIYIRSIIMCIYVVIILWQHVFIGCENQNTFFITTTNTKSLRFYISILNNICLFTWSIYQYTYNYKGYLLQQIMQMYASIHIPLSLIGLSITFNIKHGLKYVFAQIKFPKSLILFSDSTIKRLEHGKRVTWMIYLLVFFCFIFTSLGNAGIFQLNNFIVVGTTSISNLDEDKKQIPIFESTINIDGVGAIFYRYTEPQHGINRNKQQLPDILLLHGDKYASETWKGLGTLQILAYWGYKTVAIDLPGYRLSKNAMPPTKNDESGVVEFMEQIIEKLRLIHVVIVVPSMSGMYGLPILLRHNSVDLQGFIAINLTPYSTSEYTIKEYESVSVPVLIMYAARDNTTLKQESVKRLKHIRNHTISIIPRASHVFAENRAYFHREILRFLSTKCELEEQFEDLFEDEWQDEVYADKVNVGENLLDPKTGCVVKGPMDGFIANCAVDNCENYKLLDFAIDKCLKESACTGVVQLVAGQEIYQLRSDQNGLRDSPRGEVAWVKICDENQLK